MALDLADLAVIQKKTFLRNAGEVIQEFYGYEIPQWSTVGTATHAELRRRVTERLREKDCRDVAAVLETSSIDAVVEVFRRKFKTLRDRKRKDDERGRGKGQQASLKGVYQYVVSFRLHANGDL